MSVTQADGDIWVPDIAGKTRDELQRLVRGYVTAKYRESALSHNAHYNES